MVCDVRVLVVPIGLQLNFEHQLTFLVSKPSHNVGDMYTMQLGATEKNLFPLFDALSAKACFIDPFGAGEPARWAECKYFVQLRWRKYL